MKKRTFIVGIVCLSGLVTASVLSIGCINGWFKNKAKVNGKEKTDYDTTNNLELSTYVGKEIVHDDVSFKVTKKDEKDKYYTTLEITSNNPDIKSYDIIEAYTIDLRNQDRNDIITAPITFDISKTGKTAYYDIGEIYSHSQDTNLEWNFFSDYFNEFRIIGENINFTYHLWEDINDYGNGKNVDDYDCSNNDVVDGYVNVKFFEEVESHPTDYKMDVGAIVKHVDNLDFSDWIFFDLYVAAKEDVDLVQIYATDADNENKRIMFNKPHALLTLKEPVEKGTLRIGLLQFGIEDLSDDYYNLCNQNVRYHIVTNRYTLILQTYNQLTNGKSKNDYDLSILDEYKTSADVTSFRYGGRTGVLVQDSLHNEDYLLVSAF